MDWNMLIVLLGGMLLGAGGMGLALRRRPPREQQYARDMAMLADRLEQLPADGEHPFVTMPCQGDTARVAAGSKNWQMSSLPPGSGWRRSAARHIIFWTTWTAACSWWTAVL